MKNNNNMNTKLTINPKFQNELLPLSKEEHRQLTENIIKDGCLTPIIVWNNTVVDGHNRYEICTRNNIPFTTSSMEFSNESAVIDWINKNQAGRRNYTKEQIDYIIGKRYINSKKDNGVRGKEKTGQIVQAFSTAEKLAKEYTINEKTVRRLAKFADKVDSTPDLKDALINKVSIKQIERENKQNKLAIKLKENAKLSKASVKNNKPTVVNQHYKEFLNAIDNDSIDTLITDPPYSTDITDINAFVNDWLPLALAKVKPNGRCYICAGAYPIEIQAYLNVLLKQTKFIVDNPLIWTYRNTLGVTPKNKYNLNYQMIWHLYSAKTPQLDTAITNQMFSVQDINAPDGRQGDRFHTWQKPDELAERFILHGTQENDLIIDPFCGTGTFLIAAAKMNRIAKGCDINKDNLKIAIERGCKII